MNSTKLDAIEFFQDSTKHIRIYYQTASDHAIRESSFMSEQGWFIRGDGVVTTLAKPNSPISVTRWTVDKVTEIRLYFLDRENNIRECKGKHTNGVTQWTDCNVLKDGDDEPKVADGSQLAIARPDADGQTLRLFYQERTSGGEPDAGDKAYSVREIRYIKVRRSERWEVQTGMILNTVENTSLAAVSARGTGDVRLYLQGMVNGAPMLLEMFWNNRNGSWSAHAKGLHRRFIPVRNAPISAVSWFVGENKNDANLRIRIYTVLKDYPKQVTELSFDDGWDAETTRVADLYTNESAVACCRDTKATNETPISLAYLLRPNVVDFRAVPASDETVCADAAKCVVRPEGIPTSR